jgi:uncharacterized protein
MRNKFLLIIVFLMNGFSPLFAIDSNGVERKYAPYPEPDRGYVTDIAGVLTVEEEEQIESWLYTSEKRDGIEVVVVIIESMADYPGSTNSSIESFATGLFDKYGVGNMPKNNGVLLVVAVKDRKARIELGKYYGRSRDGDAKRIMDRGIVPQFKRENYSKGVMKGVKGILNEFGGIRIISGWVPLTLGGVLILLVPICISLFRNGKRGWGWIVVGLIIILILVLFRASMYVCERLPDSAGPGGFGGGFGGGSSGGGGASGSW